MGAGVLRSDLIGIHHRSRPNLQMTEASEIEARNLRLYHELQAKQLPPDMQASFLQASTR